MERSPIPSHPELAQGAWIVDQKQARPPPEALVVGDTLACCLPQGLSPLPAGLVGGGQEDPDRAGFASALGESS